MTSDKSSGACVFSGGFMGISYGRSYVGRVIGLLGSSDELALVDIDQREPVVIELSGLCRVVQNGHISLRRLDTRPTIGMMARAGQTVVGVAGPPFHGHRARFGDRLVQWGVLETPKERHSQKLARRRKHHDTRSWRQGQQPRHSWHHANARRQATSGSASRGRRVSTAV